LYCFADGQLFGSFGKVSALTEDPSVYEPESLRS